MAEGVYALRALPGTDIESRIAFSESVKPIYHKVGEQPQSLRQIIREACGDQPQDYADYLFENALALNVELDRDRIYPPGKLIILPACQPIEYLKTVTVEEGDSLWGTAKRAMGYAGDKTLAQIVELNTSIRRASRREVERFARGLRPGQELRLPHVAPARTFELRECSGGGALDCGGDVSLAAFVREHAPPTLAPEAAMETIESASIEDRSVPEFDSVGSLTESNEAATEDCPPSSANPGEAPFDAKLLHERWAIERERMIERGGSVGSAIVGVVDRGLARDGNSFFDPALFAINEVEFNGRQGQDEDGNEHKDDIWGCNVASDDGSILTIPVDEAEHGTRMASLAIGGPDFVQTLGNRSEAPVKLRVVDFNSQTSTRLQPLDKLPSATKCLKGFDSPIPKSADIVSLSLATPEDSAVVENDIQQSRKDILFVVAAGNNAVDGGTDLAAEPLVYPARLSGNHDRADNQVTVASHRRDGRHAWHSNYGVNVDIHAPGCGVASVNGHGDLVSESGTSPATAVVSFAAGLVRSLGGRAMRPETIKKRLIAASDMDPELSEKSWTQGRLNVVKAVSLTHDLIEISGADDYEYGLLDDPTDLSRFCADADKRAKVARLGEKLHKVRPNLPGDSEGKLKIEYWFDQPSRIVRTSCVQQGSDESIGELRTDSGVIQGPSLAVIKDIVLARFRN